jgi:hypothetical protein
MRVLAKRRISGKGGLSVLSRIQGILGGFLGGRSGNLGGWWLKVYLAWRFEGDYRRVGSMRY